MDLVGYLASAVLIGLFPLVYLWERRSLWTGMAFLTTCGGLFLLLALLSPQDGSGVIPLLLLLVILPLGFLVITGPFMLILVCLYNGIKILRREGLSLRNSLSLALGLGIVAFLILFPVFTGFLTSLTLGSIIHTYLVLLTLYLIALSTLYTLSSFINFVNIWPRRLDYVVVLGSGLKGDRVPPLLASRIDKGIQVYRKNPGSKLVMSGGQGPDEAVAEATAMTEYAAQQGVLRDDILVEDKSTSTEENLRFSAALMPQGCRFAVVTNYYHLFRALVLARHQRLKCIGYGARTKFYFSLNAFVREFAGYLSHTRRLHTTILTLLSLTYVIAIVVIWVLAEILR